MKEKIKNPKENIKALEKKSKGLFEEFKTFIKKL